MIELVMGVICLYLIFLIIEFIIKGAIGLIKLICSPLTFIIIIIIIILLCCL